MGDPSVAPKVFEPEPGGAPGRLTLPIRFGTATIFFEPDEPYLQPALKQAETYLVICPSFWKRLLSTPARYGRHPLVLLRRQIFVFNQEPEKAPSALNE